jgi:CubicO group peptidase (beta-lactamase class C family)
MRGIRWLGCAVALIAASGAAAAPALNERDRAAIEAMEQRLAALPRSKPGTPPAPLAQRMAETRVPAVSVAFIEAGRVKWTRVYGEAEAGSGRKATPETRFQAASMSKAVAAAGALRLVDGKRLSLDEDVALRLRGWRVPAFAGSAEKVTLRRLLSHTAGLTVAGYPGYPSGGRVPSIVQSLAGAAPANTAAVRAYGAPGAQIGYSGGGYSVAQLLMSEASGRDFPALMKSILLRPAGMARSGFDQPLSSRARRAAASGHDAEGKPLGGGSNTYPELAAAGLWTTPSDYGRFLVALQRSWAGERGALLSPRSAKAMMTPILSGYGLGVNIAEREGRRIISHGGSNEGFQCRFVAFLDGSRQGLVIMTNGENGGFLAAGIQRTIAAAYGWPDPSGPPTPRAPDE